MSDLTVQAAAQGTLNDIKRWRQAACTPFKAQQAGSLACVIGMPWLGE